MRAGTCGEFRVLTLRDCPPELFDYLCDEPARAAEYWRAHIAKASNFNGDVESLYVLALNTRRKIIGHYLVSTGTVDTLLVHAREVFRGAIVANAATIILMHCHPSGDPTPGTSDVRKTRDLVRGGELLGIHVLDHVVMGQPMVGGNVNGYCSLRKLGYFA